MNSDQGVDPNDFNQFAYCGENPFMATDPSGMMAGGTNSKDVGVSAHEGTERAERNIRDHERSDALKDFEKDRYSYEHSYETEKSWVGIEYKDIVVIQIGNKKTTTTTIRGDSATFDGGITLRGNAGYEQSVVTETSYGPFSKVESSIHTEGILHVEFGGSVDGIGAGANATAIAHQASLTGNLKLGPLNIGLPGIGGGAGIGVGATLGIKKGPDGRWGLDAGGKSGEISVRVSPPSLSWE